MFFYLFALCVYVFSSFRGGANDPSKLCGDYDCFKDYLVARGFGFWSKLGGLGFQRVLGLWAIVRDLALFEVVIRRAGGHTMII